MVTNTVKRGALIGALRIAAEVYDMDAAVCLGEPNHERLAASFRAQAAEARALIELVEGDAVSLRLED